MTIRQKLVYIFIQQIQIRKPSKAGYKYVFNNNIQQQSLWISNL